MTDIVQGVRIEGDESDYKKAVMASTVALEEFAKKVNTANKKMGDTSEKSAKKQKTSQESLTKSIVKSQLAMKAMGKVYDFVAGSIGDAVKAAAEYERTTIALRTAIQATGREVETHAKFLEIEAAQLESITGTSDEVIRKMQAQAVAFGVSTTQTKELIEASFSLANATGMDVNQAFVQLQKSTTGVIEETMKMVPGVNELSKAQLRSGDAIRVVNKQYGEFVDLQTRGTSGSLVGLKNAWGNLGEAIVKASQAKATFLGGESLIGGVSEWLNNVAAVIEEKGFKEFMFMDDEEFAAAAYEIEKSRARTLVEMREKAQEEEAPRAIELERKRMERAAKEAPKIKLSAIAVGSGGGGPAAVQESFIGERLAITARANELETQMRQEQHEHRMTMAQQQQDELIELEKRKDEERLANKMEAMRAMDSAVNMVQSGMVNGALQALDMWAEGAKVAGDDIVVAMLNTVGRQLFAAGVGDVLRGTAMTLWGMPTGPALAAVGASEMAAGAAMTKGSFALQGAGIGTGAKIGSQANNGSAGNGTTAPSFQGNMGGGGGGGDRGPTQLTVVFNGPTTKAEVGIAIKDAVREAEARGF